MLLTYYIMQQLLLSLFHQCHCLLDQLKMLLEPDENKMEKGIIATSTFTAYRLYTYLEAVNVLYM